MIIFIFRLAATTERQKKELLVKSQKKPEPSFGNKNTAWWHPLQMPKQPRQSTFTKDESRRYIQLYEILKEKIPANPSPAEMQEINTFRVRRKAFV